MAVANDRQFKEFCAIIGVPDLAGDERFITNRGRVVNRTELVPLLVGPMKARTTAQWVAAFEAAAVPCGPINTVDQVFADPQVQARHLRLDLTRSDGSLTPGVANPIRFSQTPIAYDKAPPKLGEHTASVLSNLLGLSDAEIDRLRQSGAIG
jgi:crotonobetainyl-CoA:carnitine CoA-transferase CaiB-like acyl-CoA transferase